jgi:hypothetical protein
VRGKGTKGPEIPQNPEKVWDFHYFWDSGLLRSGKVRGTFGIKNFEGKKITSKGANNSSPFFTVLG